MLNGKIQLFEVGFCKHPEFVVYKGGSFKPIKFPALVVLIQTDKGNFLMDSGYAKYFFETTKYFPEKLYAITTPVTLDKPLIEQLDPNINIDWIFISHFHADHIGGLKDFPNAKFICSKKAYELTKNKFISRFMKTKKGILPDLLPLDFENRVIYIEDMNEIDLQSDLQPFVKGIPFLNDFIFIELPGHAIGQYGLFVENLFFVSDAVWNIKTITENKMPHWVTSLIMENYMIYKNTISKLQELYKNNNNIKIIPTHCEKTIKEFKNV